MKDEKTGEQTLEVKDFSENQPDINQGVDTESIQDTEKEVITPHAEKKNIDTEKTKEKKSFWKKFKEVLSYIFIDGLGGMATGLFCTLIIGTIICQVATLIGKSNFVGNVLFNIGSFAKISMGFGIALGVAYKLNKKPLVAISAGVAGMIGAYASNILDGSVFNDAGTVTTLISVGEPLGAFIAAFVALEVGSLVNGKTKVDIIVVPLVSILSGAIAGLLVGPPISSFMTFLGEIINASAQQQPVLMGILVATIMGICLTLPISSAAIGVSLSLSGIAGGAAMIGCCCQMVGFAVISFKENGWGGLISQGIGTSMLQMPNLVKHPVCWIPPVITSVILGPIGTAVFNITSSKIGSGMGTSGLVGPIETFFDMTNNGQNVFYTLAMILLFCFVLPAAINFLISFFMRKKGWIKDGDLKL